jgi:Fic family protein
MGTRGRPSRLVIYERLDMQIAELWQRMGGLPSPAEAGDIWRNIWYQEAHHSTAIEGNTLVLQQVEALLAEGRAVGDKQLKDYMEVRGYADAARWVYGQAIEPGDWTDGGHVSLTEIRRVHEMAMTPVWDIEPHPDATSAEAPGSFREHDIQPFPSGMTPPTWVDVPAQITEWLKEANDLRTRSPRFPEEVAHLHCRV